MSKRFIEINENDIAMIGTTTGSHNGLAVFFIESQTPNIEIFLLKNILKCFGDYNVTEVSDERNANGEVEVKTNLPWDLYHGAMTKE